MATESPTGKRLEIIAAILTILTVLWYFLKPKTSQVTDGAYVTPAGTVAATPAVLFSGGGMIPGASGTDGTDGTIGTSGAVGAGGSTGSDGAGGSTGSDGASGAPAWIFGSPTGTPALSPTQVTSLTGNLPSSMTMRYDGNAGVVPSDTCPASTCRPRPSCTSPSTSNKYPDGMGGCLSSSKAALSRAEVNCNSSVNQTSLENMVSNQQRFDSIVNDGTDLTPFLNSIHTGMLRYADFGVN